MLIWRRLLVAGDNGSTLYYTTILPFDGSIRVSYLDALYHTILHISTDWRINNHPSMANKYADLVGTRPHSLAYAAEGLRGLSSITQLSINWEATSVGQTQRRFYHSGVSSPPLGKDGEKGRGISALGGDCGAAQAGLTPGYLAVSQSCHTALPDLDYCFSPDEPLTGNGIAIRQLNELASRGAQKLY